MRAGRVYFVGAGPGHPGLITVRGLALLRSAEAVVYDRLVHPRLLEEAPPTAERIPAGHEPGHRGLSPEEVGALMAERARQGKRVVRLKGGDPCVFGRAGEEAEVLARLGIPFQFVPGVTSAVAVPACAGVPVTHRDLASAFTVVTGHRAAEAKGPPVAWEALGRLGGTVVVLMTAATLPEVTERLVAAGRPAETPALVVEWGAVPRQRTLVGTLGDIARRAREADVRAPALLVVGEVVRLRRLLGGYDRGPLFGRRIGLPPGHPDMAWALEAEGCRPVELPLAVPVPQEPGTAPEALAGPARPPWLAFLEAEAVEALWALLSRRGQDVRTLGGVRILALGPRTARALEARGIRPERVLPPDRPLPDLLPPGPGLVAGEAEEARRTAEALQRDGRPALPLGLYKEQVPPGARGRWEEALEGGLDAVVLFGPEEVRRAARVLDGLPLPPALCIGPEALAKARALGLRVLGEVEGNPVEAVEALAALLPQAEEAPGRPVGEGVP